MTVISKTPINTPPLINIAAAVAEIARKTWEASWPVWKQLAGHPNPTGPAAHDVCVPTSFALRNALRRTIPEIHWKVVGGRPTKHTPAGGFVDNNGVPHPHLWVEGKQNGSRIIVDVTADQFGAKPVIVTNKHFSQHTSNATSRLLCSYEQHEAVSIEFFMALLDIEMRRRAAT